MLGEQLSDDLPVTTAIRASLTTRSRLAYTIRRSMARSTYWEAAMPTDGVRAAQTVVRRSQRRALERAPADSGRACAVVSISGQFPAVNGVRSGTRRGVIVCEWRRLIPTGALAGLNRSREAERRVRRGGSLRVAGGTGN